MRTISETSIETLKLVEIFKALELSKPLSFADASKIAEFKVYSSLPAYSSARRIARRDHAVVIDGIRGFGFQRLPGEDIAKRRGDMHFKGLRNKSRIGASEMKIALGQNLNSETAVEASGKLVRFQLISDTATLARTNRRQQEQPPVAQAIDIRAALRAI